MFQVHKKTYNIKKIFPVSNTTHFTYYLIKNRSSQFISMYVLHHPEALLTYDLLRYKFFTMFVTNSFGNRYRKPDMEIHIFRFFKRTCSNI